MEDAQPVTPHTRTDRSLCGLGIRKVERWLDRGAGTCLLRVASIQQIVSNCLEYRDGQDYLLGDYIVMPNHVHVLVQVVAPSTLRGIMATWHGVMTHGINKAVGRSGTLWQNEPFDHIVRDDASLLRIRQYIKGNGRRLPPGSWRYGKGSLFDE